ncbi:MAG: endonuclease/exonuclease/phosphatase family protein [Acidobacteriota bacterium]
MRLRILTYNIHRAIGVDRRFRLDRIQRILRHHDPDVALLQEVDDDAPRSRRLDLGRELADGLGYESVAIGHNVSLRQGRYGNATLSRLPIAGDRNIDLTIGRRKRRGCQYTRLELGQGRGEIAVFNLHLGLSASERRRQLEILMRSRELARLRDGAPCVVAGDFNDWRSRQGPVLEERLSFVSATERRSLRGPIRTYPSFSPSGGLDRIYYRGRLELVQARRCRLQVSKVASDHLPVIADFEVVTGE